MGKVRSARRRLEFSGLARYLAKSRAASSCVPDSRPLIPTSQPPAVRQIARCIPRRGRRPFFADRLEDAVRAGQRGDPDRLAVRPGGGALGAIDQHGDLARAKRLARGRGIEPLHAGRARTPSAQPDLAGPRQTAGVSIRGVMSSASNRNE